MEEKIIAMLAEQLNQPKEKINLSTDIARDLGADSLDMVEMLMTLEEQFNITVPDEEVANLKTVQDIVNFIENSK